MKISNLLNIDNITNGKTGEDTVNSTNGVNGLNDGNGEDGSTLENAENINHINNIHINSINNTYRSHDINNKQTNPVNHTHNSNLNSTSHNNNNHSDNNNNNNHSDNIEPLRDHNDSNSNLEATPAAPVQQLGGIPSEYYFEVGYVVKMDNVLFLDDSRPCFRFSHPNRDANVIDNNRHTQIWFQPKMDGLLHGFAGFFEALLHEKIAFSK
jgi:hypothetical protein